MIEKRIITIDRSEPDHSRAVHLVCASDGSAYWVSWADMGRAQQAGGFPEVLYLPGLRATFELVDGRWTLAKLERP